MHLDQLGPVLWLIWFFWLLFASQYSWFVYIYCWGKILSFFLSHNFFFYFQVLLQFFATILLYFPQHQDFSFWDGWSFSQDLFFSYAIHDRDECECDLWPDGICLAEGCCAGCSYWTIFWTYCDLLAYCCLPLCPSTTITIIKLDWRIKDYHFMAVFPIPWIALFFFIVPFVMCKSSISLSQRCSMVSYDWLPSLTLSFVF